MAQLQPDVPNFLDQAIEEEEEDWDEDDSDEEEDDDINAEAEEMTRRLGEELWANLSKAAVDQPSTTDAVSGATKDHFSEEVLPTAPNTIASASQKGDAAIITIKAILSVVEKDPPARLALVSTILPDSNGDNVLDVLQRLAISGTVSKSIAVSLGPILVTLARSDALFGNLRHSNASSIQLDKGKRKREEADDGQNPSEPRAIKRPYAPETELQLQINEAVRSITQALHLSPTQPLDPSVVSSIRLQLHQVFLFAVTSSASGGQHMHALQEISGLIQVIGVLSGIQIGQTPDPPPQISPFPPNPAYSWPTPPQAALATDIGTAVYPCLISGCKKTFSRLYTLRAHQRVHAAHRPFRCSLCPASFARNHDLKRHIKLHDNKAWKCGGCLKIFSRRDAIKRHKTGSKTRGPRSQVCIDADVLEVEINGEDAEEALREERRAKLWSGIQVDAAQSQTVQGYDMSLMEDGELAPGIIFGAQQTVLSLHGLLQAYVGGALGTPTMPPTSAPADPSAGQATLASVIARAQLLQNMSPSQGTTLTPDTSSGITGPSINNEVASLGASEATTAPPSLTMYGLSDEQTKLLEEAITNAASAAQAQAEAEAALEEEDDDDDEFDDDDDGSDGQVDVHA
ncbi:hypothetical protein H0H93_016206 [Arthromyces matolae]|nr:hypothetical protein H0H93_016206 [Arthromyces matolae]